MRDFEDDPLHEAMSNQVAELQKDNDRLRTMDRKMLRPINEFCPKGMQIKSPGGLSFDPHEIAVIETKGGRDGHLIIHFKGGRTSRLTFYDNTDGDAPDIYQLARNIQALSTEQRTPSDGH